MKNKLLTLYKKYEEYINYFIVGVCTTGVSLGSKYLLLFTILSSKNAFELQLAVVISWILAVTFAYFTNRKFVFKSKEKNMISEMAMFFAARLSTLCAESLILWFFITFLKLNSDMYVIIWTLLSQIVIFIGNYFISKFIVFKKNNKILSKKKSFMFILCILLLVLCYFFPYTHDDWAWGSVIGVKRLASLFKDYNGRWLGNIFVLLLTRSRVLKASIMALVSIVIIKYIYNISESKGNLSKYIVIVLFLLMPLSVFAQGYAWVAGFTNYVIVMLLILVYINYNKNVILYNKKEYSNKYIIPFFILGCSASLFIEHVTIYNVLLSIFIVIIFKVIKKHFSKINLSYCLGTIIGAIIMFSNGAYGNVINNQDGYRSVSQGNIIFNSIQTYVKTLSKYLFLENHFLNIFVGFICLYLIYKYFEKIKNNDLLKKSAVVCISIFICCVLSLEFYTLCINNFNLSDFYIKALFSVIYTFYWIFIFVLLFIVIFDKKVKIKLIFYLISIALIAGPLLVVNPIGPRCFFPTYILFVLFGIELFNYAFIDKINSVRNVIFIKYFIIIFISIYLLIYGLAFLVETHRNIYIKNNLDKTDLVLPKVPFVEYMWNPNPGGKTFTDRFKLFYGIEDDVNLYFTSYSEWLSYIKIEKN